MQDGNGAVGDAVDAVATRQVSVPEAARLLGISERAVRWRIQAGTLTAQRDRVGWRVAVSAVDATAARGNPAADDGNRAVDGATVAAELAVARAVLAAVEAERDHLRGLVERGDQERAELRRLLAAALQRPALAALTAGADEAHATTTGAGAPPRRWWRFWRR